MIEALFMGFGAGVLGLLLGALFFGPWILIYHVTKNIIVKLFGEQKGLKIHATLTVITIICLFVMYQFEHCNGGYSVYLNSTGSPVHLSCINFGGLT